MTKVPPYRAGMLAALGIIFLFLDSAYGESLYSTMKKGAAHYEQGSYDEALKSFVNAQIEAPEDPQVKYNIASAQYQMKNYEEAVKSYQDVAATSRDVRLEEQSLYNIGNCMYRQGKLEESLEYYKKALDLDPDDQDAKYNLEFVRDEIKKRLNQAKQREEEQQKKDQQESQDEQQQQQQEGEQKKGNEQEQSARQEQEEKEQPAGEEQQVASGRKDQPQKGQEQEVPARQMTREEAENWLRGVKEGKRDYSKQQEERAGRSYRPSKDW